ncbi:MAG: hypothetical protein R3C56_19240 [Pirellulaceae bacterium]
MIPNSPEALKTVGKQFEFIELYDKREKVQRKFSKSSVRTSTAIGSTMRRSTTLQADQKPNLEIPTISSTLDGIKKITELTSIEKIKENFFTREREKTLKKQDVEAQEAILELER